MSGRVKCDTECKVVGHMWRKCWKTRAKCPSVVQPEAFIVRNVGWQLFLVDRAKATSIVSSLADTSARLFRSINFYRLVGFLFYFLYFFSIVERSCKELLQREKNTHGNKERKSGGFCFADRIASLFSMARKAKDRNGQESRLKRFPR